jgi:hypothetical protein
MRSFLTTLFLLLGSFFCYAQTNISNQPANSKVISGNFDIAKGAEHINIVYIAYVSDNQYVIELSTANPMPLSAVVMDKKGNKISELDPKEISHSYKHSFDISTSKPDDYVIYIKHEGKLVKTISTNNN